jgi:hypothetical protein
MFSYQARMARGIHGLSKVSPGPAMLDPSTPCGRATPETALWPFRGWSSRRSSFLLDTPCHMGLSVIVWYYLRCLVHSRPYMVTLWATIATQLREIMAKNGWKNMFFTMLTFVNFYSTHRYSLWANEWCSIIL